MACCQIIIVNCSSDLQACNQLVKLLATPTTATPSFFVNGHAVKEGQGMDGEQAYTVVIFYPQTPIDGHAHMHQRSI